MDLQQEVPRVNVRGGDCGFALGYMRRVALQRNLDLYIPSKELRWLSLNFHIHVSVSRIDRPIRGIYKSLIET